MGITATVSFVDASVGKARKDRVVKSLRMGAEHLLAKNGVEVMRGKGLRIISDVGFNNLYRRPIGRGYARDHLIDTCTTPRRLKTAKSLLLQRVTPDLILPKDLNLSVMLCGFGVCICTA
ncbi:MAG TPA: hypothetical protein DEF89_25740 [Desulfosporosinus sp.]|nr:hypothetical protein [Desulfosporosinus sp.]